MYYCYVEELAIKAEGIVLAAGFSKRAGAFKMELDIQGRSVLERTVLSMGEACGKIYVIAGFRAERIVELTKNLARVRVVFNQDYESGMFGSVKLGVRQVSGDAFFLVPGDCPLVSPDTYIRLMEAGADIAVPLYRGRKGHPVLIRSRLKRQLLQWPEHSSLRDFIAHKGYCPVRVNDRGILQNINTMDDYISLRRGLNHE